MKRNSRFFWILSILMVFTFALTNCTKEGPAGPAGSNGIDGINGTDGTDGVDGNTLCLDCHTLGKMEGIGHSYALSSHGEGPHVNYSLYGKDCASCHSHQGFTEILLTGRDTVAAINPIPVAFTCKTCHGSHESFDPEDGDMTPLNGTNPVTLRMDNHATTIDMGNSNLCVNCHQPRAAGPQDDGTGMFTIHSSHYGPHHGTQSTVLEGIGGVELGSGYPAVGSDVHRQQSSCTQCHLTYTHGADYGGHKFTVGVAVCTTCHESATNLDINGAQTQIEGLIEELAVKLIAQGIMDEEGHAIVGTYDITLAQAFYNYKFVTEDNSKGVHNYDYVKTLLINSIAAI